MNNFPPGEQPAMAIKTPEEIIKLQGWRIEVAKIAQGQPPKIYLELSHPEWSKIAVVMFTPVATMGFSNMTMMGGGMPIVIRLDLHIESGEKKAE